MLHPWELSCPAELLLVSKHHWMVVTGLEEQTTVQGVHMLSTVVYRAAVLMAL